MSACSCSWAPWACSCGSEASCPGADAPPTCYEDVDHAGCIFIVGSNTAFAHPILFRRIEEAKAANPAMKIIFCDPRKTDTAGIADLYRATLSPLAGLAPNPGPDLSAIPNNHLAYAGQWFFFAAVAGIIYTLAVRRRITSPRP